MGTFCQEAEVSGGAIKKYCDTCPEYCVRCMFKEELDKKVCSKCMDSAFEINVTQGGRCEYKGKVNTGNDCAIGCKKCGIRSLN